MSTAITGPTVRPHARGQEPRVRITLDGDGVAEVAMLREDKLNALDLAMFDALVEAIDALRAEACLRAVVLHGQGRAFCAGLDKDLFEQMAATGAAAIGDLRERTHGIANRWQQVAWGWRSLPVPVIAAVHGAALGGGLQIALGADMRLVRPDARLSVAEIKWGLVPDMAGCVFLTELVRADVARDLVFSGRLVLGTEALTLGLATRVCDDPLAQARDLARQIAASSPQAIRAAKRLLNAAAPVDAQRVLMLESHEQQRLMGSEEQADVVRSAMEDRKPA